LAATRPRGGGSRTSGGRQMLRSVLRQPLIVRTGLLRSAQRGASCGWEHRSPQLLQR
jgi:hypothetical protein